MARKLRVQYPGAIYHLINRGDRREAIFEDDEDRRNFLKTLGESCDKTGWQVHALCLMSNHFHLVVETPKANLVAGMKWLLGTYSSRFNRRHKVFGHLFSGRYKSLIVDGSGTGYLKTVCDYVHLNPVRAKLIQPEDPISSYAWSSWPECLKAPGKRWAWLRMDRLLGEYGITADNGRGRRRLEVELEKRRAMEEPEIYGKIRRGWFIGDPEHKEDLLEKIERKKGFWHYGEELKDSEEAKAQRLVKEELKQKGWTEKDLSKMRKGDPGKLAIAKRLRRETTMTLDWITRRLGMGTRTHLSHLLYWSKREKHDTID
jgi:REP element-mobilizing transposase RayT